MKNVKKETATELLKNADNQNQKSQNQNPKIKNQILIWRYFDFGF